MLYILWTLLNLALFIYLAVIFFKAAGLLKEKYGLHTAIFFVIGGFLFNGNCSGNAKNNENRLKSWVNPTSSSSTTNSGKTKHLEITLEKNLVTRKFLSVTCIYNDSAKKYIPVSATAIRTGFPGATRWETPYVNINDNHNDNGYYYEVNAGESWNLVNIPLIQNWKLYEGKFNPDSLLVR